MRDDSDGTDDTVAATVASVAPTSARAPTTLPEVSRGHYEIASELARGGMGRILIARDRRIGRTVALKELLGTGDALAARFEREALVTGRLQHPAIVPVYEAGVWPSGEPFYAMKLVAGTSLDKVIAQRGAFAERLALLPNVIQICEAMAYAHGERVIHRDLKPQNVLVGKFGETVVVDWGLAKHLDEVEAPLPAGPYRGGDLTAIGAVMGTPMYMPPEQADGDAVDERADVYALGAILYHVLAGQPPYSGASLDSVLVQVLAGPPRPLPAAIPGELAAIVAKAMSRDRAARYPSAKELADELVRFQAGQLVTAHAYSAWEHVRRFVRRHRAAVLAATALVVLGGITAAVAIRQVVAARDDATHAYAAERAERATSLVDQGRRELYAGQLPRAAAFFAEAYGAAPPTDELRVMLARAMRPVDAEVARIAVTARDLAVAPDGSGFATIEDAMVRVWTYDGALARTLRDAEVRELVWDGARIVTASVRGPAGVWTDDRAVRLEASDDVSHLAARDGVVFGIVARDLVAWDEATGKRRGSVAMSDEVAGLAISADGARLVLSSANDIVLASTRSLATVGKVPVAPVAAVGDRAIVKTGPGAFGAYHLSTAGTVSGVPFAIDDGEVDALDATGARFVSTRSRDGALRVHDARTGAVLVDLGEGQAAALSRGGTRAVVLTGTNVLWVFDDRGALIERLYGGGREIDRFAIAPDGGHVIAADGAGVRIWRVPPPLGLRIAQSQEVLLDDGAASPDGTRLVAIDDLTAVVSEVATGRRIVALEPKAPLLAATFSPDGARIATATEGGKVQVWDATSGAILATLPTFAITVRFSPDGARLVTSGEDDAYVWDAATGERRATLHGSDRIVTSARFSPDGTRVLTACEDGVARLYDASSGALQRELRGHGAYLTDAVFDPAGTRVVTTSGDPGAQLWRADTGERVADLVGHRATVDGAAFSRDGARVLTFAAGEARLWSTATGALLLAMPGAVTSAAFIGDTGLLVVAGDTTATLWNASGPVVELPGARLPGAPAIGFGQVGTRGARQRVSRVAVAPDGSWLAFGRTAVEVVPLPRETRTAATITATVAAHASWRVQEGGLAPAPEPAPPPGAPARAVVKVYDYTEQVIEGVVHRPMARIDDPRYAHAWQQHDTGDDAGAYRTLVPLADHPVVRAEALRFGASAPIPADELLATLRVSRAEVAAAYEALGDYAREAAVLRGIVGDGEPAARLALARLALADGDPKEATTQLLAALALADGGAAGATEVVDQVGERGIAMTIAYAKTRDERYLLAARRVFTAYLARPRDDGGRTKTVQGYLFQQVSFNASAAGLNKQIIRDQIHARAAAVAHCFELGLARDPALAGTVVVRARISGSRIADLSTSAPPALATVASCVGDAIRATSLPEAAGTVVDITYPFTFHRVDD